MTISNPQHSDGMSSMESGLRHAIEYQAGRLPAYPGTFAPSRSRCLRLVLFPCELAGNLLMWITLIAGPLPKRLTVAWLKHSSVEGASQHLRQFHRGSPDETTIARLSSRHFQFELYF